MLIVKHRVNTSRELSSIPSIFGVEIDLRSSGHDLVLQHDPFVSGELFEMWLEHYSHQLLIINVKEDGLEEKAKSILNEFEVRPYFFLDQPFPSLYKQSRIMPEFCSARVSDYEPISAALKISPGWLWFDSHSGNWDYLIETLPLIKNREIKTCLVSPELQRLNSKNELDVIKKFINEFKFNFDAVCTKIPELWL